MYSSMVHHIRWGHSIRNSALVGCYIPTEALQSPSNHTWFPSRIDVDFAAHGYN